MDHPGHPRSDGNGDARENQDDQQKHFAAGHPATSGTRQILDQADDSPKDEQDGPPLSEKVPADQVGPEIVHQEERPDDHQEHRAEYGSAWLAVAHFLVSERPGMRSSCAFTASRREAEA